MSGGQNLMDYPGKAKCGAIGHLARPFTIYHLPISWWTSANACLLGMISERWRKRAIWNGSFPSKLKFLMKKLILIWILAANELFVSHIWRLHESTKWDFCLSQILGVCIGILCWDCTGAYLSQSNGNLVWNINCTKLPVSELITSRNLLLFWNCAISTCRSLHSIVLWFLLPLQIDIF